jgi:prophage regulatory protein
VQQIIETRPRPAVVTPLVPRDRLLRLPDVSAIVGIRKSSIYALMKEGKFPKCIYITSKTVAWPESAVLAWVNDRINKGAV